MEFFWDMFIADSLVGNFDRHNGNWGFLINENLRKIEIAPIYDCASCLYPQLEDEQIKEIINSDEEMEARVFIFPTSALKLNDKKINYFEYINSLEIEKNPCISEIRKEFYKKILNIRYEKILKVSYEKLIKNKQKTLD